MKQTLIKLLCFCVTFLIALTIISAILNKGNTDMTVEMDKASLPVMHINVESVSVNTLFGYSGETMPKYFRETLTPLPEGKRLQLEIKKHGKKIRKISYEVRSLDTERLVEDTEVRDYSEDRENISVNFSIKDLIEENKEYLLIVKLTTDSSETIKYFTRIIENENLHVKEQLKFISDFHEKTFDKEKAKTLVTYLESNEQGDNSTFGYVNIHSSFNQVTWGDLDIIEKRDLKFQILELDPQLASVRLEYLVKIKNGDETEDYNIDEYYRIRYTKDRTYLLDFERNMNQILNPENNIFINDKVLLGIMQTEPEIVETPDGSALAFVQENALYEYKNTEGNLVRIYSFYDKDNYDIRSMNRNHKIEILNVEENGNLIFMVCGYMNRGVHEGDVGLSLYYYDCTKNTIEEKAYVSYAKFSGLLEKNISYLSYVNKRNEFYLYLDDCIYCINLYDKSMTTLRDNITRDELVASKSNQIIAYGTEDGIQLMDLSNGKQRKILSDAGDSIQALGFIGEDLVYGLSHSNDTVRDATGSLLVPMHTIVIEDRNGRELKRYNKEDEYIINVTMDDSTIQMHRVHRDSETGNFYSVGDEQIMNNQEEEITRNSVTTVVTQDKEKVTEIALINNVPNSIHVQTPKEVITEGVHPMSIKYKDKDDTSREYYVYAKGILWGVYEKPVRAILQAADLNGVVVNEDNEYVWQKGNREIRTQIKAIEPAGMEGENSSLAVCLNSILSYEGTPRNSQYMLDMGENSVSILKRDIDGEVLDLDACSLPAVLYYVSRQFPVLATVDGDESVLIVGYDEKNLLIMDPRQNRIYKKGMNDSAAWFKEWDNRFVAYLK